MNGSECLASRLEFWSSATAKTLSGEHNYITLLKTL